MRYLAIAALLFSTCLFTRVVPIANGQEWTRFRGPNGTGISHAKTIPTEWGPKDVNWKVPLPGIGHSSPAVWGERVFLTSADAETKQFIVLCVSASDGRILWQKGFPFVPFRKHNYNSFASGSPCVDEKRVYLCRALPEGYSVLALDHQGELVWERNLGPFQSQHGGGHSPIVYDAKVILGNEQDGDSYLVALDFATGKVLWKTPRKTTEAAYSTPCVYEPNGTKPQLIFNSESHGVSGINPITGAVLWEFRAFDKRVVSSPIVAGNLIIGSTGSGGGGNYVVAVHPASGDNPASLAYSIKRSAPYVPTSVYHDGLLFLWNDGGIASCVKADSGEVKWQERVGGNFFSSPIWVDGRIFCVSTRGEVAVVEASETFKVLARNPLNELTHSTPAVAGGRMYIHTSQHIISIGGS